MHHKLIIAMAIRFPTLKLSVNCFVICVRRLESGMAAAPHATATRNVFKTNYFDGGSPYKLIVA
jgi:hypothetical protein